MPNHILYKEKIRNYSMYIAKKKKNQEENNKYFTAEQIEILKCSLNLDQGKVICSIKLKLIKKNSWKDGH